LQQAQLRSCPRLPRSIFGPGRFESSRRTTPTTTSLTTTPVLVLPRHLVGWEWCLITKPRASRFCYVVNLEDPHCASVAPNIEKGLPLS
jgi:hypothetical protein